MSSSVDVIVPCYRYGHFLRQCVESVLVQHIDNLRVLIIDDASPDNTAEIAADLASTDSRITISEHSVNKGHIATYNEGIDWAAADYMLILSADDYLLPGALKRSVSLMDAYPNIGLTYGKSLTLTSNSSIEVSTAATVFSSGNRYRLFTGAEFIALSGSRDLVSTPTAVVRTVIQKRVGHYRRELPHSGDMEMWLRIAAHASIGFLDAYQAVYRRHSGNMSAEYLTNGCVGDVEQRKAAIDCFIDTCRERLTNADTLHHRMLCLLARDAVGLASTAFNERDMGLCSRLSALALDISPEVKGSWPWAKLTCKRVLGLRGWRVLGPAVRVFRPND